MDTLTLSFLLVIFASIFQGSFGLGMKFMAPLKWEAWWLVHSTFALIILPTAWAYLVVPDLFEVVTSAPSDVIIEAMIYGGLWGIGGILFGKSVPYIGISLTYGIVMGVCSAAGALIPLFMNAGETDKPSFPYIMVGVLIMLVAIAITAYAGIQKDKLTHADESTEKVNLTAGLVIAVLSGLLSAALAIGFGKGESIGKLAEASGAIARNGSLAIWVVVLWGGFVVNAGYSLFLLAKNNTWSSYSTPNAGKAYLWSIGAAVLWFGALGIYGQGATLMGDIGKIIAWPIMLGLSLIVGNVWAYTNKEWEGAKKPFKILLFGVFVLIIAVIITGYSGTLNG
ncbi:L-rhamnose/proton symporter RhaT [Flavobacterium sp. 7A]|uniref:L-rhamnose/proton symporter RhaT n=1 Tax=Flavobacterium sp. 7A TaxID=2940571 RepID=UPI0022272E6E|nr:L-rhamnose/proton symporter RhaT [Flavobacterium sp. 7A]MCW2119004.1 L-rhamnose-H+ transport protein [Flavobacterium sp. 7A]